MTTLEIRPTPDCGNPAHYDEESYCPHCHIPMCADWDNCPAPNAVHDVPNCEPESS